MLKGIDGIYRWGVHKAEKKGILGLASSMEGLETSILILFESEERGVKEKTARCLGTFQFERPKGSRY